MKLFNTAVLVLCFVTSIEASPANSRIAETKYFAFYSNPWINMHHFLYQKAKASAFKRTITDQEGSITAALSTEEQNLFDECTAFYRQEVVQRDLLFNLDLTQAKTELSRFEGAELISGEGVNKDLYKTLNRFAPLYFKHYWQLHDQANRTKLTENEALIRKIEQSVMTRFSQLAQNEWPNHKTRVDITAIANWAGAYTTIDPIHVVISSTRDNLNGTQWLEILFHEPGHYLIGPSGNYIGNAITEVAKRNKQKPSRSLWHALLFYFSGIAIQEALAKQDIEHDLYMKVNDVFSRHHEALPYFDPYINGTTDFEAALQASMSTKDISK